MPNIDYYLTSSAEITKKDLKYKSKTPLLTPDIDLGARKFNKSQLNALKLLLCNCVKHDIGFGKIGQPLRVAITGGTQSPSIDLTITLLDRENVISRLKKAIEYITNQ